jgi:hypothetical protein
MKQLIRLKVNGADEDIYVEPWWSLAHVLREELNLNRVKVSCGSELWFMHCSRGWKSDQELPVPRYKRRERISLPSKG